MNCTTAIHNGERTAARVERRRPTVLARAWARVCAWHERARQRRSLATLEPHLLDDIGLLQVAAAAEAAKPFWRD